MTDLDWLAPPPPETVMDEEETALAHLVYDAIHRATHDTERSKQANEAFLIGVSDLGTCAERTRRVMAGVKPEETDKLEAFIGSWVGAGVEAAVAAQHPDVLSQVETTVTLDGDAGHYEITGHADLVHPWGVGDVKTVDGLNVVKRSGPSRQQLFQRHLLCLGLHQQGQLDVPLDEAYTYNVWLDRAGRSKETFVHRDRFNPDVVAEATHWLDETVYCYRQGIAAAKEPPRPWCAKACGYFADCRLYDSDVEGLITDLDIGNAVLLRREATALTKRAKQMASDADAVLEGISGYVRAPTGEQFQVRETWVNPATYTTTRKGFYRLSVTPVR